MTRFLGARGASVVVAFLALLIGGSNPAQAQAAAQTAPLGVTAPTAANFDFQTQSLINAVARSAEANAPIAQDPAPIQRLPSYSVLPSYPPSTYSVTVHRDLGASVLTLAALVEANSVGDLDEESSCLATAVYFESKGEPLEGQLAVAQVVMNRAASGRYPASLCGVVKQHAQFSFVRSGNFPAIDASCAAWRKARAIARIAEKRLVAGLSSDVLWYHADYVAPRWRQALVRVEQIGAHIFYRA